ncbi:DUF3310 domain-containing protein [Streptococcus sp. VTCC 12886]|uniref:DUF3310 domain-containing protein n=1 Tax=Streptococcus sp. VTCC 12886 TaxID=3413767 RepID=UPI003D9C6FA1
MTEETKLYIDGTNEPYVVLGKDEHDVITNPSHYKGSQGIEAIEVHKNFLTEEELRGYYKGNTLKYLLRERNKNGLEDLKKARKHLDWLIELEEKND